MKKLVHLLITTDSFFKFVDQKILELPFEKF